MTNEKRLEATRGVDADGNQIYASQTNDSEFDLTKWAIEKFDIEPEDLCGNLIVARVSFNKALDLVMEEAKDFSDVFVDGCKVYISDLESIISKLRGER